MRTLQEIPQDMFSFQNNTTNQLQFDTLWDWIIPVVQKIRDMAIPEFSKKQPVINALISIELPEIHKAVIEFIQWHNKQKA